jgi:site-specific DNA recombinase
MPDQTIAVGYVRVSTEEQEREGYSLGEQERRLREAGAVEVFADAGVSGRGTAKREGLQRLFAKVNAGEVSELLIPSLDRLGRNARDLLNIIGELDEKGGDRPVVTRRCQHEHSHRSDAHHGRQRDG